MSGKITKPYHVHTDTHTYIRIYKDTDKCIIMLYKTRDDNIKKCIKK